MSIWIENKLAPHSYEKTLVAARTAGGFEKLIIWLEGTNTELSFHPKNHWDINPNPFGMCGGSINTNTGVGFTKEMLLEIANKMKEGSILKVAACNSLYLTKKDLEYSSNDKTVSEEFAKDNDMVQIGNNKFAPSTHPKVLELKSKNNDL